MLEFYDSQKYESPTIAFCNIENSVNMKAFLQLRYIGSPFRSQRSLNIQGMANIALNIFMGSMFPRLIALTEYY